MSDLFTIENLLTLGMLILLQAVLGFDNLLYISLESKRVPADKQAQVRRLGIGLAIFLRIALLFAVVRAIRIFEQPFWEVHLPFLDAEFTVHSAIVLAGGVFIIYTATKEIFHLLSVDEIGHEKASQRSVAGAVTWIVIMNLVFSFDSILSAMALSDELVVMGIAIVISGVLMVWLADHVAEFLQKNRMYEVLGLFILFIVGIMLVSEGGHLGHLRFFGNAVMPMAKTTFYFVLAVLVLVDVVQGRYQKKLLARRSASPPGLE